MRWLADGLAILLIAFPAGAQATIPPFPPGSATPSVACHDDASQTYALYLPSTFSLNRRWPIIYVAEIYKEYFAAPAHFPNSDPALEYGDIFYHTQARRIVADLYCRLSSLRAAGAGAQVVASASVHRISR